MNKSADDELIEKANHEVSKTKEDAFTMLCLLIAMPEKLEARLEWYYCLGKLFSLADETRCFVEEDSQFHYDESRVAIINEKIEEELGRFSLREKIKLAAFLTGASRPFNLDVLERIARGV